ncbi:adenylyl-sulfate kinase [Cupriavidus taiwanensis]
MICHSPPYVEKQALSISRADRERLNGHKGSVIWFTGLSGSGSGKSTLANALEVELRNRPCGRTCSTATTFALV